MSHVMIKYVALRPFWYQDIRTGERVDVQPTDMVDADGLGPIADKMCGYDLPSLARIVTLVDDPPSVSELVEEAEEDPAEEPSGPFPQHIGFGNWRLSNGETVKGKDAALAAQEALDGSGE